MKKMKNIEHSVRSRLYNIAKQKNVTLDSIVLRYMQERFLYRLSQSDYKNSFILKGGLLLLSRSISGFRPTKDIDLLGYHISNNENGLKEIFSNIAAINNPDGLTFSSSLPQTEIIKEGADYEGLRINIGCSLGKIKKTLQIDIGFDDVISGEISDDSYPCLLDNEPPVIRMYPLEVVIAEKLQAITKLNYQTSRLKDFYDIYYIICNFNFNGKKLFEAIGNTFMHRETNIEDVKIVMRQEFATDSDKNTQWNAFLKRQKLNITMTFKEIIGTFSLFFNPLLFEMENNKDWDYNKQKWI